MQGCINIRFRSSSRRWSSTARARHRRSHITVEVDVSRWRQGEPRGSGLLGNIGTGNDRCRPTVPGCTLLLVGVLMSSESLRSVEAPRAVVALEHPHRYRCWNGLLMLGLGFIGRRRSHQEVKEPSSCCSPASIARASHLDLEKEMGRD